MSQYIIRLDDAAEKRDRKKWSSMESLLDQYGVKPLVGVIPDCKDPMMDKYQYDEKFWDRVQDWIDKGWIIAMHGYQHLYTSQSGGINPVNKKSEFAGETLDIQKKKIEKGITIMHDHGIEPKVFFAPGHTFDENTLLALKEKSDIRIVSDTVADKPYSKYGITFVPQQSGKVRALPFNTVTFCYHPNNMEEKDFLNLENFIKKKRINFIEFPIRESTRSKSLFDNILSYIYFLRR